jgi:hypothetical protein
MKKHLLLFVTPLILASTQIDCTSTGIHDISLEIHITTYQDFDVSLNFNHPSKREDGTALSLSEISGYETRTVLHSGGKSQWVFVPIENN